MRKTFNAERKNKMLEMHEKGLSYQEIGKVFNISRQRVYMIIGGHFRVFFKPITSDECIYPNLRKWMNDNRVNRAELCRRLYDNFQPHSLSVICNFLKGHNSYATKHFIDKCLKVTGLTYEELFETKEREGI